MTTRESLDQKLNKLQELAGQAASSLGLEVLAVKVGQQGKYRSLEVCILHRTEPVSLTACEKVSRALESLLEVEESSDDNFLRGPYVIEVVSPGIDRQLINSRDFELFAGRSVRVKTKDKIGSYGNDFIGTLVGGNDNQVRLCNLRTIDTKASANTKRTSSAARGKEKTKHHETDNLALTVESKSETMLDLSKILKINLYPDDLKANATEDSTGGSIENF